MTKDDFNPNLIDFYLKTLEVRKNTTNKGQKLAMIASLKNTQDLSLKKLSYEFISGLITITTQFMNYGIIIFPMYDTKI